MPDARQRMIRIELGSNTLCHDAIASSTCGRQSGTQVDPTSPLVNTWAGNAYFLVGLLLRPRACLKQERPR